MNRKLCLSLDDYRSGLLNAEEHDAFVQHFHCCSICQNQESQTQTIEETISRYNASHFIRPEWQEQMESALRGSLQKKKVVYAPLVEPRKSHRDWRPTAAVATSILAAMAFLMFRFPAKPTDNVAFEADNSDLPQTPVVEFNPTSSSEIQLVSVSASAGFLCARLESDEPDIEYYVVLPHTKTPRSHH